MRCAVCSSWCCCCGVPIQFTSSNGDPADPTSLHYVSPLNELNQYERVIRSVGEILMVRGPVHTTIATVTGKHVCVRVCGTPSQHYDSDKKVPVFGFGCYLNGGTHHCLPLTMDPEDVEVDGVSGILEAYRYTPFLWCCCHSVRHVVLMLRLPGRRYGPCNCQGPR